jgi:hypothetical protein
MWFGLQWRAFTPDVWATTWANVVGTLYILTYVNERQSHIGNYALRNNERVTCMV